MEESPAWQELVRAPALFSTEHGKGGGAFHGPGTPPHELPHVLMQLLVLLAGHYCCAYRMLFGGRRRKEGEKLTTWPRELSIGCWGIWTLLWDVATDLKAPC